MSTIGDGTVLAPITHGPIMTHPVATSTTTALAVTSSWWIPTLREVSETAGLVLPILAGVLICLQIAVYVRALRSGRKR